jgi:hypothetical protein
MSGRTKRAERHSETKVPAAHNHPKHKIHAFWPPWLGGPLVLVLGAIGHYVWGRTLPSAAIVPLALVLSTAVLSALTHRYAAPRNAVQRWHAVLSVLVLGLSLSAVQMFGTGLWDSGQDSHLNVLGQAVLFLSAVLALSWNIRRFEVIRGEGQDKHGQDSEEDWHGLKKPRSLKVVLSDGKKTQAKVKLAAGQTAKDVEAALGPMGSDLGTITNGIRVEKGTREGEVELTMLWEDQLTDAVGWEGPEHIGGSIADPISLGVNEQQKRVILRMAGDYDKGVAPGHVKIVGMPRSGKGIAAIIIWTNLRGRRDVYPVFSDHAKGEQMLRMLRPGMPKSKAWINTTEGGAKAQAAAVMRSIAARNKALGAAGMSSWEPKAFTEGFEWRGQHIRMPAIVFHIEEFAPIGIASPGLFTTIGEQGLSAGVFLIVSTQRASHDRFPTSLRSLISNGVCYGAHDDTDVSFALPDGAVDGGATPAQWQTRFPGRAMASLNGADPGMERIPWKTHYAASKEEFEDYVTETMSYLGRLAPDLDPCTAEAFGQAYADYLAEDEDSSTTAPTPPPTSTNTASAPAAPVPYGEDDDEEDDDVFDDDPNEAEYVRRPMPADLPISHIDPYQPLPEWEGDEVDLSPPPRPGKQLRQLSPQEKRVLFREILQRLADAGEAEVSTGRLVEIWTEELGHPSANQSPTVGRYIADAAAEDLEGGKPNDLFGTLERVDGGRRGRYRVLLRPRVAVMNGHGA